jgi:hypothetical protein
MWISASFGRNGHPMEENESGQTMEEKRRCRKATKKGESNDSPFFFSPMRVLWMSYAPPFLPRHAGALSSDQFRQRFVN